MADTAGADDKIFTKGYKRTFAVLSPATEYAAVHRQGDRRPGPAEAEHHRLPLRRRRLLQDRHRGRRRQGARSSASRWWPPSTSPTAPPTSRSALTKIKREEARRHHRLGPPRRGRRDRQAGQGARRHAAGGFGETVAPPTPDFAKALGAAAEGVLGSTQWTDTDRRLRTSTSAPPRTTRRRSRPVRRPRAGVPRRRGDARPAWRWCWPWRRPARPSRTRSATRWPALDDRPSSARSSSTTNGPERLPSRWRVIQIQDGKAVTVWPKDSAEATLIWPGTSGELSSSRRRSTACSRVGCWRSSRSASPWCGA